MSRAKRSTDGALDRLDVGTGQELLPHGATAANEIGLGAMEEQCLGYLVAPQQADNELDIDGRVRQARALRDEPRQPRGLLDNDHAPPIGYELDRVVEMAPGHDGGTAIKDTAERIDLAGQPTQGVSSRLDLVAMQVGGDHSEIGPDVRARQPELLDNANIPPLRRSHSEGT